MQIYNNNRCAGHPRLSERLRFFTLKVDVDVVNSPFNIKLRAPSACNFVATKAKWVATQSEVFACQVSSMRGTTSQFESFCR